MIDNAAFGWDQLRRMLCRLRRECKQRIPIPDPFWPTEAAKLQVTITDFSFGLNNSALIVGADPTRVGIVFNNGKGGDSVFLNPGSQADHFSRYVQAIAPTSVVPAIFMPNVWGPIPQMEWYGWSEPPGDVLTVIEYRKY